MGAIAQAAAAKAVPAKRTIKDLVKQMEPEIERALPKAITPDRFTRIVLSAVSNNQALASCTPQSFLGAMMTAAQLGLEPNTPLGQAYLIPFNNTKKGVTECTFQLGYKGLLDLAYRSGQISTVTAQAVYANDEFEYELGLEPKLKHIPAKKDRGDVIAFYGLYKTKDGGYGFEVMSVDDIRKHAQKYSKAYNSGPWQSNFEEMAKKTVLKRVLKYAPMATDFSAAVAADNSIKTEISPDMMEAPGEYVDAEYTVGDAEPVEGGVVNADDRA